MGVRRAYQFTGIAGAVADSIHAIETGGTTISPAEEARKAVAVLMGIIDSHFQDGKRVQLDAAGHMGEEPLARQSG